MASRNSNGTRILKAENVRVVKHLGTRIQVSESLDDTIISRTLNTSFRPGA